MAGEGAGKGQGAPAAIHDASLGPPNPLHPVRVWQAGEGVAERGAAPEAPPLKPRPLDISSTPEATVLHQPCDLTAPGPPEPRLPSL